MFLRFRVQDAFFLKLQLQFGVTVKEVDDKSNVEGGGERKRRREATKHENELESPEGDEEEVEEGVEEKQYGLQRGSHSYGIQPLGNLLLSTAGCNVRDAGLGALQVLSDETISDILSNLDGRDLARLSLVSRAFYVFAHQDSLWRNLVLEDYNGKLGFQGCWKTTYLTSLVPNYDGSPHLPLKVQLLHVSDSFLSTLIELWQPSNPNSQ